MIQTNFTAPAGAEWWEDHRRKIDTSSWHLQACIARSVGKKEYAPSDRPPAAQEGRAALKKEWKRLIDTGVWSYEKVREWNEVARTARHTGNDVHLGRLFGIMVGKGSELSEDDA